MSASTSRLVRVFISSTFRDFMGERDELVKRIFPELRRRCKSRFVELLEVDLRWGITEEQSKSGETLRICLQEIDRCRPSAPVFFIGMLGERYGWIPPEDYYPESVTKDPELKWVKKHIGGKSVTELEILHGVLNNNVMRDKAFFYFRNDGYEKRHWPEIAEHHEGIVPPLTPEDFTNAKSENPAADEAKQQQLKKDICDASLAWDPRPYETPEELGKMVFQDLADAIDRIFPEDSVPGELERQALEHESFGESRARGYVPRPGLFEGLDWILGQSAPSVRVVTGESGGGKSALFAAWLRKNAGQLPPRTFVHYIGGTPESSTARSIVMRLMKTIRSWGALKERVPDDFGEAVQLLPEWLKIAAEAQDRGVLIVLDALNQLESAHDQTLWWLPKELPSGVRLLVSTLPGPAEEELKSREWMEDALFVSALREEEKELIIASYLSLFSRTLEQKHVTRLMAAPQTANPLFLKVVLDELRIRGRYEALGDMISRMLEAKDPVELFKQVLKNLEEYDKERPNLVRDALGYLAAARRGLTESELLQLLSSSENPAHEPLPRSIWSPLYLALEESLISRDGRLGFFHNFLKKAVEERFLSHESDNKEIHGRFGEVAINWKTDNFSPTLKRYAFTFGTYHLKMSKEREVIWEILSDRNYFEKFNEEIKQQSKLLNSLQEGIESYIEIEKINGEDLSRLAYLLYEADRIDGKEELSYKNLLDKTRSFKNFSDLIYEARKINSDLDDSEAGALFVVYFKMTGKDDFRQSLIQEKVFVKFPTLKIPKELIDILNIDIKETVEVFPSFNFNCRNSLFFAICKLFQSELCERSDEYNEIIDCLNYISIKNIEEEFAKKKSFLILKNYSQFNKSEIYKYVYLITFSEYFSKKYDFSQLKPYIGTDEISVKIGSLIKLSENQTIGEKEAKIIRESNSNYFEDKMLQARFGFLKEALQNSYNDSANILDTYISQLFLTDSKNLSTELARIFDISESSGRIIRDTVGLMVAKKSFEYGMKDLFSKASENFWKRFDTYSDGFYDEEEHASVAEQALKALFVFDDEFLFEAIIDYLNFDDIDNITNVASAFDELLSTRNQNSVYIEKIYNKISDLKQLHQFKIYINVINSIFASNSFLKKCSSSGIINSFKAGRVFSVLKSRHAGILLLWLFFVLTGRNDDANSLNKYIKNPLLAS